MMNDNNTGLGIAGEPEPAVPPEAEQTSVSLPSFIAPFHRFARPRLSRITAFPEEKTPAPLSGKSGSCCLRAIRSSSFLPGGATCRGAARQ